MMLSRLIVNKTVPVTELTTCFLDDVLPAGGNVAASAFQTVQTPAGDCVYSFLVVSGLSDRLTSCLYKCKQIIKLLLF